MSEEGLATEECTLAEECTLGGRMSCDFTVIMEGAVELGKGLDMYDVSDHGELEMVDGCESCVPF